MDEKRIKELRELRVYEIPWGREGEFITAARKALSELLDEVEATESSEKQLRLSWERVIDERDEAQAKLAKVRGWAEAMKMDGGTIPQDFKRLDEILDIRQEKTK